MLHSLLINIFDMAQKLLIKLVTLSIQMKCLVHRMLWMSRLWKSLYSSTNNFLREYLSINLLCQSNSFVRLWISTKEVWIGTWTCIVICFLSWFKLKSCWRNILTGTHKHYDITKLFLHLLNFHLWCIIFENKIQWIYFCHVLHIVCPSPFSSSLNQHSNCPFYKKEIRNFQAAY